MRGIDRLAEELAALSEGISSGVTRSKDHQIFWDSTRVNSAIKRIVSSDDPHSAASKLRRDVHFNLLDPLEKYLASNRRLPDRLAERRLALQQLNAARKRYTEGICKDLPTQDRGLAEARASFESAKEAFNSADRRVFEWLYILEEYHGDIFDSMLQITKQLHYTFFVTSAHAISSVLPAEAAFRPVRDMTPELLDA